MRDVRLLPLVIVAIAALLMLKAVAFLSDGRSPLGGAAPALAQEAQPAADAAAPVDDAGAAKQGQPNGAGPAGATEPAAVLPQAESAASSEERSLIDRVFGEGSRSRDALVESLSERRQELEAREAELDLRENLLRAAEQRLETRIAELKALEAQLTSGDDERRSQDTERLKGLVVMYENMKPKDAARIFNRLDLAVVVRVARAMNARQMSTILAEMDSEAAQRLTLELSAESEDPIKTVASGAELPKIIGTQPAN